MTVFLLGPSRDASGGEEPLQLRRHLVERIRATATDAIVMEDVSDHPDENNLAESHWSLKWLTA